MIAAADRMHARGRDLIHELLGEVEEHQSTCSEDHGNPSHEAETVAAMAVAMFESLFACGHPECIELNIKAMCEGQAYAVFRTANHRPVDQRKDVSHAE